MNKTKSILELQEPIDEWDGFLLKNLDRLGAIELTLNGRVVARFERKP